MKKIMFNDKYGSTNAVLSGRKTQVRRIEEDIHFLFHLKNYDNTRLDVYYNRGRTYFFIYNDEDEILSIHKCKYTVGEVVAVAQPYKDIYPTPKIDENGNSYIIGNATKGWSNKMYVQAINMPHRIQITNIRLEKLQDISDEDCLKERIIKLPNEDHSRGLGEYKVPYSFLPNHISSREAYAELIDKISGKGTWLKNPYVFVYDFKLIK